MAGVDLRIVGELLGHSSIQMTMRYAHLAPLHNRAAVDRLVPVSVTNRSTKKKGEKSTRCEKELITKLVTSKIAQSKTVSNRRNNSFIVNEL
jgi:hypothetical protein